MILFQYLYANLEEYKGAYCVNNKKKTELHYCTFENLRLKNKISLNSLSFAYMFNCSFLNAYLYYPFIDLYCA